MTLCDSEQLRVSGLLLITALLVGIESKWRRVGTEDNSLIKEIELNGNGKGSLDYPARRSIHHRVHFRCVTNGELWMDIAAGSNR